MHNLGKQEVQVKLKKKLERLEFNFYGIRKQILNFEMDSGKIAFTALSMLKTPAAFNRSRNKNS